MLTACWCWHRRIGHAGGGDRCRAGQHPEMTGVSGPGLMMCLLAVPDLAFYAVGVETFTFLFTDIEGSTALLRRVGDGAYAQVLAAHHALIRSSLAGHGGTAVACARAG